MFVSVFFKKRAAVVSMVMQAKSSNPSSLFLRRIAHVLFFVEPHKSLRLVFCELPQRRVSEDLGRKALHHSLHSLRQFLERERTGFQQDMPECLSDVLLPFE